MQKMRTTASTAGAGLVVALLVPLGAIAAQADPLPAEYDGSTHGDILSLELSAAGIDASAALGHSATATDSTGTPRAHAESANLEAGAVGVDLAVVSGEADADNDTGASYRTVLGEVDVPGVLDTGLLTGSGSATWAGDAACVPDGTPIAESTTSLAGATAGLELAGIGIDMVELGTVETSGQTTLQDGSVVSTSSGNLASLSLFNDSVNVEVLSSPTLTATSDGTTGTVTTNDYSVDVTIAGDTTTLNAGGSIPISLNTGLLHVDAELSVGEVVDNSSGATADGSMTFLQLTGSISLSGSELASLDFGVLPLSATATAPEGGVECDALDPPVITSPADGSETGETPTISGTGVPGATVTVTEDGEVIGTAEVDEDGNWSLVPDTPLDPGEHTIEATQELGDAVSGPSEPVTFEVVVGDDGDGGENGSGGDVGYGSGGNNGSGGDDGDGSGGDDGSGNGSGDGDSGPEAPVITSPEDGDVVDSGADGDSMVTGTGEPGATVTVILDDEILGTAEADGNGNWEFPLPASLACGSHTLTAVQTDADGNTSEPAETVTFEVICAESLPSTGATGNLVLLSGIGALALLAGLLLTRLRRE